MRGACGKCGGTYDGQMLCPTCGIQLDETGEGETLHVPPVYDPTEWEERTSVSRRLAVGTLCALGLYHGFKCAAAAVVSVASPGAEAAPEVLLGALGVALFLTAILLGTANHQAEIAGVAFCLAGAGAFLAPAVLSGDHPPTEWLAGLAVAAVLAGGAGGLLGRALVPPAPRLPTFGAFDARAFAALPPARPPMHWIRLFVAAAVIVGGAYWADPIRVHLAKGFAGSGGGGAKLVCWMIGTVAAIGGGVGAGANTRAGVRQGIGAGILAAVGTIAAFSKGGLDTFPAAEFWMDQVDLKGGGPLVFIALALNTIVATTIGGYLGAAVLPPRRPAA